MEPNRWKLWIYGFSTIKPQAAAQPSASPVSPKILPWRRYLKSWRTVALQADLNEATQWSSSLDVPRHLAEPVFYILVGLLLLTLWFLWVGCFFIPLCLCCSIFQVIQMHVFRSSVGLYVFICVFQVSTTRCLQWSLLMTWCYIW